MHRLTVRLLTYTALLASIVGTSFVVASSPKELTWEQLIPGSVLKLEAKATVLQQHFAGLSAEERKRYQQVAHELSVRQRMSAGLVTEGDLSTPDLEVLQANPSQQYPKAKAFWTRVEELDAAMEAESNSVEPSLNGREVRLPGYVLPVELDGEKVQEFLLVPYVGACIHTPPPPANQLVYVRVPAGFKSEGLYSPVWVEGTMLTGGGSYDVDYIDGNRAVAAGYALDATKVEPYED